MKDTLDIYADAIDNVLQTYNVAGRCTGGTVTHRYIRFDVATDTPNNRVTALSEEFALALNCNSVMVDRAAGGWIVQMPRTDNPVTLAGILKQYGARIPALTAVLGMDNDGAPIFLRIPAGDIGHVCIVGNGAKRLLRTMFESLIRTNERSDLQTFGYPSDSHAWHYTHGEKWQSLQAEIERREREHTNHPMLAIGIPELADANDWIVGNWLQRGAAIGVHILAASEQRTEQKFRVMIEGIGQGRFVLRVGGQEIEFTCATVEEVRR